MRSNRRSFALALSLLAVLGMSVAVAVAENGGLSSGLPTEQLDSTDPRNEYPAVVQRTINQAEKAAPIEATPGPVVRPDEIHVPIGEPENFFVEHCLKVISSGSEALESEPLCRVVMLMKWGKIEAGVYPESSVKELYESEARGRL